MNQAVHNKLVSFIWSIADDCLRDVYVRGKYRDVILPMTVLRRLDALLEPTKDAVMEELTFQKDEAKFLEWEADGLKKASGYVFYNTSEWTLQRLHDTVERTGDDGIASKLFDNSDFGYYKVSIERPKRLKAQFTIEKIAELRFDKSLREPMEWAYQEYGETVYSDLMSHEKDILDWCDKNELNLNAKQSKALVTESTWQKGVHLMDTANSLMKEIGTKEFSNFNEFIKLVNDVLKKSKIAISASEKNAILNAVSWYDAEAEKVEKGLIKLQGKKLDTLLAHLGCNESQLADYGYFPTAKNGEPASRGWYLQYETESDLRDTENVPLKDNIHSYFLKEVKPHVCEAWINLDATKIGYEISFNKYFYRHKPLRSLEEVTADILALEAESDGLIREILNLN